jgi:hypothetical protein
MRAPDGILHAARDDHDLDFLLTRIGARVPFREALTVMIPETLSQIEARIRQTSSLTEDNKAELLKLLAALRTEIGDLARTKSDEAHRIAAIAHNSTEAATHDQTNPELVKQSLDQLASAVSGFEESHPRLVEVVNRMATMLARSGI